MYHVYIYAEIKRNSRGEGLTNGHSQKFNPKSLSARVIHIFCLFIPVHTYIPVCIYVPVYIPVYIPVYKLTCIY